MAERSTIYEVARRSGVSTATVSRVMHDGRGFSERTRKKVLDAAGALGWVPNSAARSLAARRVGIVGLLFPDLGVTSETESESVLYVDQVIRGAERAATQAGDAILIAATHSAAGMDLAWRVAGKVDGIVVVAGSLTARDIAAISRRVPVVVLATGAPRQSLDVVATDNRGGMRDLTTHLVVDHGYTDLAFLAGPARSPDSNERFAGYREALDAAGLPVPDAPDARGGFTEAGGARAMRELLAGRAGPPRAVVAGNDEMAIAALGELARHGLRSPHDVAVTGFDDIASARHVKPTLTTVRQPMRESAETAVHLLLDRLRDPEAARRRLILPTEVVLRRSCGCRPDQSSPGRTSKEN
ncbi:MAG: LacI family DNA-binding transcriptional regulator [Nocardioidaceae bacterium]